MGRLQSISLSATDREIYIHFERSKLIIRMTGRNGGIWLESENTIVASLLGPTPKELGPLPQRQVLDSPPRFIPKHTESWDEAARLWYSTREIVKRREIRTQNLRKRLNLLHKKTTRLVQNLSDDLDNAEDSDVLRGHADLLGIHLYKIATGVTTVSLSDPMNNNLPVTIKLDPSKSPVENMNRLYAKSRRLERMTDRVLENLERAEQKLNTLDSALIRLENADDSMLSTLENAFPNTQSSKRNSSTSPKFWSTWKGPNNETVLVGKNEAGNRKLITQKSRGDDIWMHIRERPGPHVVIPMRRNQTPTLSILLVGAQIAILHAKMDEGDTADVQYAQIRHIRPIPGDQLGRVTVQKEKVLHISREAAILTGWLKD